MYIQYGTYARYLCTRKEERGKRNEERGTRNNERPKCIAALSSEECCTKSTIQSPGRYDRYDTQNMYDMTTYDYIPYVKSIQSWMSHYLTHMKPCPNRGA